MDYIDRECGQPDRPEDCSQFSEKECIANPYCTAVGAAPVNESEQCLEPGQFVMCMDGDTGCDDALCQVRDPSGKLWQFGHGCTPPGWGSKTYHPILDVACTP